MRNPVWRRAWLMEGCEAEAGGTVEFGGDKGLERISGSACVRVCDGEGVMMDGRSGTPQGPNEDTRLGPRKHLAKPT